MNIAVPIVLCFIPLMAVFVSFALLAKEFKLWQGLLACILGMAAVVPIAALQFFLDGRNLFSVTSLAGVLLSALVLNGLVEESIKMGLLCVFPARNMKLQLFYKYCILSGLTLGCFESLIYLISGYERIGLRMLTAVLIHMTCAVLDGLFVYGLKHRRLKLAPFFYAVFLHGFYNYFAGFGEGSVYFYLSFAVIAFAVIECRVKYLKLK